MMKEILDVEPQRFRPSIPNLVYQYDLYTNYLSAALQLLNPEVDEADSNDTKPSHQGLRIEHSDDKMVIPTHQDGGKEVPMYSEEYVASRLDQAIAEDPNCVAAAEVLSPEVEAMVARREATAALKKALEGLTVLVENSIKARVRLSKADENNREMVQGDFNRAVEKLDVALEHGEKLAVEIDAGDGPWKQVITGVAQQAKSEMRTKKQLMVFSELVRKHAQELFQLQKAMLADIKEAKRRERAQS